MARMTTEPVVFRSRLRGCVSGTLFLAAGSFGFAVGPAGSTLAQDGSAPTRIDRTQTDDSQERQPTVRVEELGPPGTGSSGTLTDSGGGLGSGLWRGASITEVTGLMDRLPAANRSPTLRSLQRRVLLTLALAPSGKAKSGFGQARLQALVRMGALRDTLDLAARSGFKPKPPYPAIRARFLSGDGKSACAAVAGVRSATATFIEQARIACHVLSGHGERAEIALRLLHEQGAPPAKAFEKAVLAAAGGRAPKSLAEPHALSLALLRNSGAGLKSADLEKLSTGSAMALSANPKMGLGLRIRALERAVGRGAPVGRDLAALYAGVRVPKRKIDDAAATRLRDFDSAARTHLYLAATSAKGASKRLRLLAAWWRLAAGAAARGDDGAEMLAAQLTVPLLKGIEPAPAYQDYAAHIARAFFAAGKIERALVWYRFLRDAPFRNPADLHRITALAVLATPTSLESIEAVEIWIRFKHWRDGKNAAAHLADLKAMLDGLGRIQDFTILSPDVSVADSASGGAAGAARDPALLADSAAGRRGLTVLRVLTLVNGRSLRRLPRRLLQDAVFGLRAVGLEREARQLAIEAALARRL